MAEPSNQPFRRTRFRAQARATRAGIIVWFGCFGVLGGGLPMTGQADGLPGALDGAFRFESRSFLGLIYLSIPDGDAKSS